MYKKGLLLLCCMVANVVFAQEKPLDPFAATIQETKESNAMFLRWKKHRDLYKH